MTSILPIIRVSELQRGAKSVLAGIEDYAVIRSHSTDVAFVLHPSLGKVLLDSGMLEVLKQKSVNLQSNEEIADALKKTIGNVLRELSKQ